MSFSGRLTSEDAWPTVAIREESEDIYTLKKPAACLKAQCQKSKGCKGSVSSTPRPLKKASKQVLKKKVLKKPSSSNGKKAVETVDNKQPDQEEGAHLKDNALPLEEKCLPNRLGCSRCRFSKNGRSSCLMLSV